MSFIYKKLEDFYNRIDNSKAEEYYRKTLKLRLELVELESESILWKKYLTSIYIILAYFYQDKNKLDKAKNFYEKALNILNNTKKAVHFYQQMKNI